MAAIAVLATACGVAVLDWRRRSLLSADVMPWMIDEIAARAHDGRELPTAVLGVALHGPPPLAAATDDARRVWSSTGDALAALRELPRRTADPGIDRLCAAVEAVDAFSGDAAGALARLRAHAVRDARRSRQIARASAATRCAAWFALVPVVAAAFGVLDALPTAVTLASAVGAWAIVAVAPGAATPRIRARR